MKQEEKALLIEYRIEMEEVIPFIAETAEFIQEIEKY